MDPSGKRVLAASRPLDFDGLASSGRHQFLIVIPDNPKDFAGTEVGKSRIELGGGHKGFILGAYNIDGNLKTAINADTDTFATWRGLKGFDGGSLQTAQVKHCFSSDTAFIQNILSKLDNYNKNSAMSPLQYPSSLSNISGTGLNSNSFAQSLLRESSGYGDFHNFSGYNAGQNNRIESWRFQIGTEKQ